MTERAGKERNPVTHSTPQGRITSSESQLPSFDPSVPNPARMWNYWLGGKDNFAADREAAERVLQVMPSMPLIARAARLFLIDALRHGPRAVTDCPPRARAWSATRARSRLVTLTSPPRIPPPSSGRPRTTAPGTIRV